MLRVLKLGGSLYGEPELAGWAKALAGAGGRVVVVPGGGPFADAVRAAQARWRFPDSAAHRMALLAMEQYGLMLAALAPGLVPAADAETVAAARAAGRTPVWLPAAMCLEAPDIRADWTVTSDSLALWLARRLGAGTLALVKHDDPGQATPEQLSATGWLDPAFPAGLQDWDGTVRIFGRHDLAGLRAWLG